MVELLHHGMSPGRPENVPQFMGRVGPLGPVVVELCAPMSHLWQGWRHTQTCATSGVVGSPLGILCPSEAENVPELILWVGLWVLQAETGAEGVVVVVAVCVCERWGPQRLCHRVQPVPGDTMVSSPGDQSEHKLALRNIASMVRPGGVLVIDHRNYDHILATGCAPPGKNIYYKVGGWQTLPHPHPSPLAPRGPGRAGSRAVSRLGTTESPQATDILLWSPE